MDRIKGVYASIYIYIDTGLATHIYVKDTTRYVYMHPVEDDHRASVLMIGFLDVGDTVYRLTSQKTQFEAFLSVSQITLSYNKWIISGIQESGSPDTSGEGEVIVRGIQMLLNTLHPFSCVLVTE